MAGHDDRWEGLTRRQFLAAIGGGALVATNLSNLTFVDPAFAQIGPENGYGDTEGLRADRPRLPNISKGSPPQQALREKGLTGYCDPWSVQPGETVRFMVSSEQPRYSAEIVRLVHAVPDQEGPGLKEVSIKTPINGSYAGTSQDLPLGSYVTVPNHWGLQLTGSFTITAWIAPTTIPGSDWNLLAAPQTPAHSPRPQGILTKWSPAGGSGYGLFIDEDGSLALWLGSGGHVEKLNTGIALRPWPPSLSGAGAFYARDAGSPTPQGVSSAWYFVAASYDATSGQVTLYQRPLNYINDPTRTTVEDTSTLQGISPNAAPVLMAAGWCTQNEHVDGLYNGKIDNPRLYARALSSEEVEAIQQGRGPADTAAWWDFSADISSEKVTDLSQGFNGYTVNRPTRGVTGHNWTKEVLNYQLAPDQYGAIHFHDDDLADSRWDVDFQFRVPWDLKNGVYAAKLKTNQNEYYVPFFVRPRRGTATAKIALLIETTTYMAYGSIGTGPNALSLYTRHTDGSGVAYSSYLRPFTNDAGTQPSGPPRHFVADTFIIDWLNEKGFDVDVITDQDLHREGEAILSPYKVVLTGTHPEYPTSREIDALQSYTRNGGRLMYLGGNGFYWVTAMGSTGHYIEVRRRDGTEAWQAAPGESHLTTTGEEGGLRAFRGRPPQEVVGIGFTAQAYGGDPDTAEKGRPYKRRPGSFDPRAEFIFEGVGSDELIGDFPSLTPFSPGVAADELDRVDYTLGSPPNTIILATATGFGSGYQHVIEEVNASDSMQGGTVNPFVRADLVHIRER